MNATAATTKSRPIESGDPMPFGKHKGIPINEVPGDYLAWAIKNMDCCNPDHDRYWSEFTATLESLVGSQTRDTSRPKVLPIGVLCARLKERGITLWVEGKKLVASETPDAELQQSIQAHANVLIQVLTCAVGNSKVGLSRSAFGLEIRRLVKTWYRGMSQKFHPDMGGSEAAQIAANECYGSLMQTLETWERYKDD